MTDLDKPRTQQKLEQELELARKQIAQLKDQADTQARLITKLAARLGKNLLRYLDDD